MALRDSCIGHWKLENLNSVIGNNLTLAGAATWVAGRFNNGWYTNNDANYIYAAETDFNPNIWIWGTWIKPDGWSVTNGQATVDRHAVFNWHKNATNRFLFHISSGAAELTRLTFTIGGVNTIFTISNGFTFADGSLNHIAVVVDRTGIDGGADIVRVYLNGTLVFDSIAALGNQALRDGTYTYGVYNTGAAQGWHFEGVIDNPKIYPDDSTQTTIDDVVGNRDIEGWIPDAPANVVATDGTYTEYVGITWDDISWADEFHIFRSTDDITFTEIATAVTNSYNDQTGDEGTVYYYRVSAETDDGGEGDQSVSDTGYRGYFEHTITCAKTRPQVLMLTDAIDIYDLGYVDKILKVQESKTFRRDKLIVNSIKQKVKNFDNFFSVDNPVSVLSNIRWRYDTFRIINNDGETIWDGVIEDIQRDHKRKTATIISVDELAKFAKTKITYTSSAWETPAEAFKNICDDYGFTGYNLKSVQDSINQQDANSCQIKCNFSKDDDCTLQQALEKLGEVGCADVYTHKNEIYYQHYQPFTGGVKVNLTESDLLDSPVVSSALKDIVNDYRIGYEGDGGTPATDGDNNDIGSVSRDTYGTHELPELDCSNDQEIVMKDLTTAVYIGECYIRRTHIGIDNTNRIPFPLTVIKFTLKETNPDWIDLRTYFNLTLSDEGWTNKTFEIFGTTIDYSINKIQIIAYEVDA